MKYPYDIRIFRSSGRNWLEFTFPQEARILSDFLFSDIGSSPSFYLKPINRVLTNESERELVLGDVCGLEVYKETTMIYSSIAENCDTNACEIPTIELKQLIEEWVAETQKFQQGHQCEIF